MGKKLISLGHGPNKAGGWDPGASGNGTTEANWLRGKFLQSLKKYAGNKIDFYEQNLFANKGARVITGYSDVTELHLDGSTNKNAKGGHVIIFEDYKPDATDKRLGAVMVNHFGLRKGLPDGKEFSYRSNLYNLNVFAARKISYRLLEMGFVTNVDNMKHFEKNYDSIAKDIIEGILNVAVKPATVPVDDDKEPERLSGAAIAQQVIDGKWGNGAERNKKLKAAGYHAATIQKQVNTLLKKSDVNKSYTVKAGDTLSEIARDLKVTQKLLKEKNGIKNVNLIKVGQKLVF